MQYKCSRESVGHRCFAGFARFVPGLDRVNERYLDGTSVTISAGFDSKRLVLITSTNQTRIYHAPCQRYSPHYCYTKGAASVDPYNFSKQDFASWQYVSREHGLPSSSLHIVRLTNGIKRSGKRIMGRLRPIVNYARESSTRNIWYMTMLIQDRLIQDT